MSTVLIENSSESSMRADVLLANHYPEYSRAALAKLFVMEKITKDGTTIRAGEKIQPQKAIVADISELAKKAEAITLPVLYEDENVVVVNKPAGVISHARGRYWDEPSVASFIRDKVAGLTGERAGIVHRLDRATSGVMICAKNQPTIAQLQKQFSDRKVHKTYVALVEKPIEPAEGLIDVPIGRNPNNPKTFRPDGAGKVAQTEYHATELNNGNIMVKLHPLTGRTHQLRVHLQYIKHPIIGDELYGGKAADRLYLHANTIEITLPGGERKIFAAPLPPEFDNQQL